MSSEFRTHVGWKDHAADFANVVKAFLGTNYLSIAFGFLQGGLGIGIGGLLFMATVTDHCCHLIVKCKYHIIGVICKKHYDNMKYVSDDERIESTDALRRRLQLNMDYADLGRFAFGKVGAGLVHACLLLTQIGFCIQYAIFLGNTAHTLFPLEKVNVTNHHKSPSLENGGVDIIRQFNSHSRHKHSAGEPFLQESNKLNFSMPKTQQVLESNLVKNGSMATSSAVIPNTSTVIVPTLVPLSNSSNVSLTTLASTTEIVTSVTSEAWTGITATMMPINGTTEAPYHVLRQSTAPPLELLVLCPLPFFIAFTLFRNVRHMGFVSMVANVSCMGGFIAIVAFLILNFHVSSDFQWYQLSTLPVFFGAIAANYEGIGTILPIEGSMEGNHHNYPAFLHGAILILSSMMATLGIMGYLVYGSKVEQIIIQNLPSESPFTYAVNITLMIGVLLTYPLQVYPIVDTLECWIFGEGKICGPSVKDSQDDETGEDSGNDSCIMESEKESLLRQEENFPGLPVASFVPKSVPAWKRNIFRILIASVIIGAGILLRNVFAYVGALVGAAGSSPLAFIFPCLFHMKMKYREVNKVVVFKDGFLVIFGIVASIISIFVTMQQIVQKL